MADPSPEMSVSMSPLPRVRFLAGAFLACVTLGCTSYPTLTQIAPEVNATLDENPQFLIADDEVEVAFPIRPEWNHTTKVRRDGRASFLFLDEMVVAGMTLEQLDAALTTAYSRREGGIELTVNLVNAAIRTVTVTGEVDEPGPVQFNSGSLTLLEAIGKAGGHDKATALMEELMLIRWSTRKRSQRVWRINANVDEWQNGMPIYLQANDVIYVPNNFIDKVNIFVRMYITNNLPIPLAIPIGN